MVYFNKSENDIMCKQMLDDFQRDHKDNFRVDYSLTRQKWDQLHGRPSVEMFSELKVPTPSKRPIVSVCGPQGFNKSVAAILSEMGYDFKMVHIA